jgi:hypothetical protein
MNPKLQQCLLDRAFELHRRQGWANYLPNLR